MDDSTRHFIDEDQSTLQEVQTEDTPTHDVHDVIKYDEHDLSGVSKSSSESSSCTSGLCPLNLPLLLNTEM
ncbi:hypothetical protein Tco_1460299 [Tanacetum coccineum]